jgi:hypothetical protein
LCRFDWSFPLVGLEVGDFTVGRTALKATSNKMIKYEETCFDNQYAFISYVSDTCDFLAPETLNLLKIVQRVMHSNVVTPN